MIYQYYDPHPHICRMKQYECCRNHTTCPLYHLCKKMNGVAEASKGCKRNCATCNYTGCTMPLEKRKTEPFYIGGWLIKREDLVLSQSIEIEREKERTVHLKNHAKLYHYYNMLWNEEYRNAFKLRCKKYKNEHREQINQRQLKRYHEKRADEPQKTRKHNPMFMPPCKYDCFNCSKPDCDVPNNYYQQQVSKHHYEQNKEQILQRTKKYQKEHPEQSREYSRKSYYKHREQRLQYAREYRETHKKELSEKFKQYHETHKEERNAKRRQWYEKNREQCCAKRRAYYAQQKVINQTENQTA